MESSSYFARQRCLRAFGPAKQDALGAARVLIIGAGGIGSGLLPFLAGAGIGHLTIVDPDVVDATNLHRQVIHGISTLHHPKVQSAAHRCKDICPLTSVQPICAAFNIDLAQKLVPDHDIICDCTDNLAVRLLVSDAAMHYKKKVVCGSAIEMQGQILLYGLGEKDSYRSLLAEKPAPVNTLTRISLDISTEEAARLLNEPFPGFAQSCAESGVLGPVPGLIGTMMALETIRLVTEPPQYDSPNFYCYDYRNPTEPMRALRLVPKAVEETGVLAAETPWRPEDYVNRCPSMVVPELPKEMEVDWNELSNDAYLVDVRPEHIAKLSPPPKRFSRVESWPLDRLIYELNEAQHMKRSKQMSSLWQRVQAEEPINFFCQRGNASRVAAGRMFLLLQSLRSSDRPSHLVGAIAGSLFKSVKGGVSSCLT